MRASDIPLFFQILVEATPKAETELFFHNSYTLLIAVVLSAQATDVGVNKATKTLFAHVKTPKQMLALDEDGLKAHIKTIGLYPTKARHIMALSRLLVDQHQSKVPDSFNALCALPGVGRKTANVVLMWPLENQQSPLIPTSFALPIARVSLLGKHLLR